MTSRATALARLLPGLAAAAAVAVVATLIGTAVPVLGPAAAGVLLGLAVGLVLRPGARLRPGLAVSSRFVLQIAVVLLGAGMSLTQVWQVGVATLPVMLGSLAACLLAAGPLGRLLGVPGELRVLIGVGTGICGASAIAAVSPVIRASRAAVAYAVPTIFLFNVAAVLLFPALGRLIGMDEEAFGLFAGTAVNDTSSVVAAASIVGGVALAHAVVVKLARTLMIVPITVVLAVRQARRDDGVAHSPPTIGRLLRLVPWFLVGFLVLAALTSLGAVPESVRPDVVTLSTFLITAALAAIGMLTDVAALRATGLRPLVLGGALWVVVAGAALLLMWATGAL